MHNYLFLLFSILNGKFFVCVLYLKKYKKWFLKMPLKTLVLKQKKIIIICNNNYIHAGHG